MSTYRRQPVAFVEGRGALLFDAEGREYIDLLGGIAVAGVGHAHPKIAAAIAAQSEKLIHTSNLFENPLQEELADRLAGLTGGMSSFFCNSGAEAVECALKLARKWGSTHKGPGAIEIVAAEGSFHGRTFGALAATGQPTKQARFAPMLEGFAHVGYGDLGAMEAAVGPKTAAVILEPIQGESGVIVPPAGYLAGVRALCDERDALLILDEVQTGMGRTGKWFSYEHSGIRPDVLCLAKSLAGGLPMGACLATPDVAATFVPGDHGSTFGGGYVQSAAALAVIDVIEVEGLCDRAAFLGERLAKALGTLFDRCEVRGAGLLIGVDLGAPLAGAFCSAALKRGVIVNDPTPSVVRFAPPLVIAEDEIDRALNVLQEVWDEIRPA
jgi:predicted acetylornithine/succinylornithine family transaminase